MDKNSIVVVMVVFLVVAPPNRLQVWILLPGASVFMRKNR